MKPEMTASDRRRFLFKKSRPLIRKLVIMEGDKVSRDIGVLWAAYKAGSFPELPVDMDEDQFLGAIDALQKSKGQVWLIDDFNPAYKDKRGPVAMACTSTVDLVVNAEGCAFKWATKRNILRCSVSFLHMIRRSKATGICMVKCSAAATTLMRHLQKDYRTIMYMGKAAKGAFLYAAKGDA